MSHKGRRRNWNAGLKIKSIRLCIEKYDELYPRFTVYRNSRGDFGRVVMKHNGGVAGGAMPKRYLYNNPGLHTFYFSKRTPWYSVGETKDFQRYEKYRKELLAEDWFP